MEERIIVMDGIEEEKKTIVHHVFLLDESGSMGGIRKLIINGFNEQIQSLKQDIAKFKDQEQRVTFVTFSGTVDIKQLNVPAENVQELTEETYKTCGSTALYDTIGTVIKQIKNCTQDKVVLNILTDGEDTCSHIYTAINAKEFIEQAKKDGWVVTLVGANIDVEAMIAQLGIAKGNAINFNYSSNSVMHTSNLMSNARTNYLHSVSRGIGGQDMSYYSDTDSVTSV